MPTNVIMPQMGESIFEGTITRWLKKPGDPVQRDEALFEISTDKVDAEIPSPAAGVLSRVLVPEGETVQINTVVAEIEEAGAAAAQPAKAEAASQPAKAAPPPSPPPSTPPPAPPAAAAPPAPAEREPVVEMPRRPQPPAEAGAVRSSPLVRRMAAEHGVDLSQVPGSGLGGRITKADILAHIEAGKVGVVPARPAPPPAATPAAAPPAVPTAPGARVPGARVEAVPMSTMRQKIAAHMVESKRTSPHVHTVFDVDMSRVARLRARTKAEFEQRNGVRLTYLPFIARAAVTALKAFPYVNSSLEGTNIVLKKEINLGIAVVLEWGLIVPVIKNAEEKNFLGLAKAIRDLADRARAKKLSPDEVQNGTFTITNPGQGALFGTPIISQPQVAILGVGHIHKAPVVIDDAIAIRSIVYLSLGYDHRVVDGVLADQFMAYVKKTLENWEEPIL
jgi:2-oxoglutarate dehydrogenase E2 component (dihydrolipoamide succinyltransferase)